MRSVMSMLRFVGSPGVGEDSGHLWAFSGNSDERKFSSVSASEIKWYFLVFLAEIHFFISAVEPSGRGSWCLLQPVQ